MLDPFLAIAETLELSSSERAAVERYRLDSGGRAFLPMADVLRTHNKRDESVELMIRGLANHPGFSVARVILARELYNRGLVGEALNYLHHSPVSLDDNALAQKLLFRLYLLANDATRTAEIRRVLDLRSMLDDETRELSDAVALEGFDGARAKLIREFAARGIHVQVGGDAPNPESPELFQADTTHSQVDDFSRTSLVQVFAGIEESAATKVNFGGVALDSTTLAEIYEKQRLFAKALDVYRRLLRVNPGSEFLKQQLRRVAKLAHEQKREDLEIDASIVDEMEQIEVIDQQIRFYTKLLNKLS